MKKYIFIIGLSLQCLLQAAQTTIFAHGIIDTPCQIKRFIEAIATPDHTTVMFPDAYPAQGWGLNRAIDLCTKKFGKTVNRNAMFMGQSDDLQALDNSIKAQPTHTTLIGYGTSRGAATWLTYTAIHNPENLHALVLDACPCSMPDAIKPIITQYGIHETWAPAIFKILFPQYKPDQAITPLQAIALIKNKNLPILLLHSKTDTTVPYAHSVALYLELKKHGFHNIHMVSMPHGRHSFLLQNSEIKTRYLQAVHSFYKKYNLPYNEQLIDETILSPELTDQQAQEIIDQHQAHLDQAYQSTHRKQLFTSSALLSAITLWYIARFYKKL
ncbi:prolyl oligopeptidase family serine peptidase [Candidatus Babeliales bacterium]|nr:prolyl oligopeptidase family serine peptidase [Candidatus Babeliales bacterium]